MSEYEKVITEMCIMQAKLARIEAEFEHLRAIMNGNWDISPEILEYTLEDYEKGQLCTK